MTAQWAAWRVVGLACVAAAVAIAGCGGSGGGGKPAGAATPGGGSQRAGVSAVPLTLTQVKSNLEQAGYRVQVYPPDSGVLDVVGASHKADAGLSIDYGPSGQQLYGSVYQTSNAGVRRAIVADGSDSSAPIVRGELIFTDSGPEPELQGIVKDAGDLPPSAGPAPAGSSADAQGARAALQQFIRVYAVGDEKAVCASFTPQVLSHSQTFCDPRSTFYKRNPDPRVSTYQISDVTTSGDKAVATVIFQGITEQLALRRIAGQWKIDTMLGAGHLF